jgi:hypothetical protein
MNYLNVRKYSNIQSAFLPGGNWPELQRAIPFKQQPVPKSYDSYCFPENEREFLLPVSLHCYWAFLSGQYVSEVETEREYCEEVEEEKQARL